jgi:uncharacterized cupredoxin-like copper-binding protein
VKASFYLILAFASPLLSVAAGQEIYTVEAGASGFKPAVLNVPAGQKIKLVVKNTSSKEVEFESYPLNREEKVAPGVSKEIYVGPLKAGSYEYFDDNNDSSHALLKAE